MTKKPPQDGPSDGQNALSVERYGGFNRNTSNIRERTEASPGRTVGRSFPAQQVAHWR
jgi:hypothetical protein